MRQFQSLPSFQLDDDADSKEEHHPNTIPTTPLDASLFARSITKPLQPSITGSLQDIPTTQSFVAALQSTMAAPIANERVVIIPGDRKRTRNLQIEQEMTQPTRRLSPRLRHGLPIGAIVLVLIITLISLAPLDNGQSTFHIFGGVIEWARAQEQDWNIPGHVQTVAQSNPIDSVVPTVAAVSAPISLPTNQYVAMARQDAINVGISPDYFVRQIYAESSFNPNAVSPYGAVGIAQFLPSTAAGLGVDPWNPASALMGAARLMASYANHYGGDYAMALAAYNAGSGTVQYAVNAGGANWMGYLPAETRNYIRNIMGI